MYFRQIYFTILIPLVCIPAIVGVSHCQEPEQIKQKILASLAKIENYPAGIVKGRAIYRGRPEGIAHIQFRGNKMWMELDDIATADEETKRRMISTLDVMGTSKFLYTAAFDGKRLFEFSPQTLRFTVQSVKSVPHPFFDCAFLPKYWIHMGGSKYEEFRKIVEYKEWETKVEQISEGRWKLSQINIGGGLPGGNAMLSVRDRFIIVDEKYDYLVTEYYANGFHGKLAGTLVWDKQDGNWYAKKGKQMGGDKPFCEWSIEEISFDASKCRNSFDDLETTIPFATCITHLDEKYHEISKTYKGGAEGEAEFRLRGLARLKRSKEEGF